MIDISYINGYFPPHLASNAAFQKHILKEYIQLMVLDYLADTPYIGKLAFIGGTNLRLIKGIDRFSEDLDFDCRNLSEPEFMEMTDGIVAFLKNSGLNVESRDKVNPKLTAFRRNIYFPEFLLERFDRSHGRAFPPENRGSGPGRAISCRDSSCPALRILLFSAGSSRFGSAWYETVGSAREGERPRLL